MSQPRVYWSLPKSSCHSVALTIVPFDILLVRYLYLASFYRSYTLLNPAPNARHHPRPYSSSMRDFMAGRRVHAVVRLRPFGYSKIYNARQRGILNLVICPIMLLINYL